MPHRRVAPPRLRTHLRGTSGRYVLALSLAVPLALATPLTPVQAQEAAVTAEAPQGQVTHDRFGLRVTLPATMAVDADHDDRFEVVDFDRVAMRGQVYSLMMIAPESRDEMLEELSADAEATEAALVTIGGVTFDRYDYVGAMPGGGGGDTPAPVLAGSVLFTTEPGAFGTILAVHIATVGQTPEESAAYVAAVLDTMTLSGDAADVAMPAPFDFVDGMLVVPRQRGMEGSDGGDYGRVTLVDPAIGRSAPPLAELRIETGISARLDLERLLNTYAPGATVVEGAFYGEPAWVIDGTLREGLGRYGGTPAPTTARSYVLRRCTADGDPIVIRFAGTEAWLADGNTLDSLVALPVLTMPADAVACDEASFEALAIAAGILSDAPVPTTLFGGLGTLGVPPTWLVSDRESLFPTLREANSLAYLHLDLNGDWRTANALSELIEGAPEPVAATLFGRPAQRIEGALSARFRDRAALSGVGPLGNTPALGRVYRIEGCVNGAPLLLMMAAREGWLAENGGFEALESLVTMDLPDPVPACQPWDLAGAESFLGGVLRMRIGWDDSRVIQRNDPAIAVVRRANSDTVRLTAAAPAGALLGEALNLQHDTGPGFEPGVRVEATEIMGEAAHVFHGRRVVWRENRAAQQVVLFDRCLPDGSPVVMQMEAPIAWFEANDGFDFFLHHSWLVLPQDAPACDPAILAAAIDRTGATADGLPAEPPAGGVEPPPAEDTPPPTHDAQNSPADALPPDDAPAAIEPPQDDPTQTQLSDGPATPSDPVPAEDLPLPDQAGDKPGTQPPAVIEEPDAAELDRLGWQRAQSEGTPAMMLDYLARFPDGAHAEEARAWLMARAIMPPGLPPSMNPPAPLAPILGPDDAAWNAAEQTQSPAMMLDYLAQFPTGLHAEDARAWLMARAIMPPAAPQPEAPPATPPATPPVQRGK